ADRALRFTERSAAVIQPSTIGSLRRLSTSGKSNPSGHSGTPPVLLHPLAGSPPPEPSPDMLTVISPCSPLALMVHWSFTPPDFDGLNCTWSVTVCPGSMPAPSWRLSTAVKPTPVAGGFDLVTSTRESPVFFTWNSITLLCPTGTAPKNSPWGETSSFPGSAAVPETGTSPGPAEVSSFISSVNVPTAMGANVTVTVTDVLGPSVVPAPGIPVAENGLLRAVTL